MPVLAKLLVDPNDKDLFRLLSTVPREIPGNLVIPNRLMPMSEGPNGCAVTANARWRMTPPLVSHVRFGERIVVWSTEATSAPDANVLVKPFSEELAYGFVPGASW